MHDFWTELQERCCIEPRLIKVAKKAEEEAASEFRHVSENVNCNQLRVLNAFRQAGITEYHLRDGTGYGYGDLGREGLEELYALTFGSEAAFVRAQIVSGTHAITLALTALLKQGEELLSVTGRPYDTLASIIGITGKTRGSLVGQGIDYQEVSLTEDGLPDYRQIGDKINRKTRVVLIQRSRGYSWRNSLSVAEIGKLVVYIKNIDPGLVCFVDNCYGEFAEAREPTHLGADLIAGSLIKNPGGGLAPAGGYLAGKKGLVSDVSDRLIAPGLGARMGTNLGLGRLLYQGFFMAPHIVGEALRGAVFAAHFFTLLGFDTSPLPGGARTDIVQAVKLNSPEEVMAFCKGIQAASPVDARAIPEPGSLPGYSDQIIMAAGTFVQGASIELTADAPLRTPYIVYIQGGLSYAHMLCGLLRAAQELFNGGMIR